MTYIEIPGHVANQLRQGLTLKMGEPVGRLEQACICHRRERSRDLFAAAIEQIEGIRDLLDALGWEHVESDPEDVRIDLGEHSEALENGLGEAALMLRTFTKEGSPEDRAQAQADLAEVEGFAVTLRRLL